MGKSKDQIKSATKSRRKRLLNDNKELKKSSKWYRTEDVRPRFKRKTKVNRKPTLRRGLTEGQVLILLSGRFRGRRVILLKQLTSGLLLVTGPYKLNGVPLKRVNQAYVLGTRTKVNLSKIPALDKVNDDFFKRVQIKDRKFDEGPQEKKNRVTEDRRNAQNNVDTEVIKTIKSTPMLREYLQNRFSLKNGQQPHNMVI